MDATLHRLTDTEYLLAADDSDQFTCGIDDREIRLVLAAELIDHQAHGIPFPDDSPIGVEFVILPDARDVHPDTREQAAGSREFTELDMLMYSGGIPIGNAAGLIGDPDEGIDHVMADGYPMFPDAEDAEAYIEQALDDLLPQLVVMIGFFLDKRVNMLGATGWDLLTEWCVDPDYDGLKLGGEL